MILAAALLVLTGLGLFVAGVLTGVTALFWICVGACLVAGVLLVLARRRMARSAGTARPEGTAASAQRRTDVAAPATSVLPTADGPGTGAHAAVDAPEPAAPAGAGPTGSPPAGRHAPVTGPVGEHLRGEPPVEEVEVTDLLLVLDLRDEVLVVDEHPRYHLGGCRWLTDRTTIPLPIDEARTDGFTPCGTCAPDQHLADVERGRRAGRKA